MPVLMACWAMGRLLGPQLMVAGGGHQTHQWFGMYYAGQSGRRLPVPVFQALEDFTVYLILIAIERALDRWPNGMPRRGYPTGIILGTTMVLWGIERSLDEHLWLGQDGALGSDLVQLAGVLLVVGGAVDPLAHPVTLAVLAGHAPGARGRARTGSGRTVGLSYSSRGPGIRAGGTTLLALTLDGNGVTVLEDPSHFAPGAEFGYRLAFGAFLGRCDHERNPPSTCPNVPGRRNRPPRRLTIRARSD